MQLSEDHVKTIEATVKRLTDLRAQREELERQETALKGFLRASLGTVSQMPIAGMRVTIASRKVFDADLARKVLDDEELDLISITKLDPALARFHLAQDIYEKCLKETEAQVRIS